MVKMLQMLKFCTKIYLLKYTELKEQKKCLTCWGNNLIIDYFFRHQIIPTLKSNHPTYHVTTHSVKVSYKMFIGVFVLYTMCFPVYAPRIRNHCMYCTYHIMDRVKCIDIDHIILRKKTFHVNQTVK